VARFSGSLKIRHGVQPAVFRKERFFMSFAASPPPLPPMPDQRVRLAPREKAGAGTVANLWLGQKLRGLRQMRSLSIKEVATLSGLSVGAVSQMERGISSPSVRSLRRLADVLTFTVADLMSGGDPPPLNELGRIVRAQTRGVLRLFENGISKELLSPSTPGGLEQLLVTLDRGATSGPESYTHKGEECGYVLEGRLELTVDSDTFVLHQGDSFRFRSTIPHRFRNAADHVTRVIWTIWNGPVS
jgi:transcriptional regulator with XRE-family HTH domain